MNILGINKVAVCGKRSTYKFNNKIYYLVHSTTDERSNIVPFRDSQFLYQCFIFEQVSSTHVKVTVLSKINPVPWCHSTNVKLGLRRQTTMDSRIFKTLVDLPKIDIENVPYYVEIERQGFEAMIQRKKVGTVIIQTEDYTITELSRFKGEINMFCSGNFRKKTSLHLNTETLIRVVFQNRCRIIESNDDCFVVLKGPSKDYNAAEDKLEFSAFYYSDECVLYHFKSTERVIENQEKVAYFFFNKAYIMLLKDTDGYWNVQMEVDFSEKTTGLSVEVIRTFLKNMKDNIGATNVDTIRRLPTLKFAVGGNVPQTTGHAFFVKMQRTTLSNICSMLSKKDVKSLRATCKQLWSLIHNLCSTEESDENCTLNEESPSGTEEDKQVQNTTKPVTEKSVILFKETHQYFTELNTYKFNFHVSFNTKQDEEKSQMRIIEIEAHNNVVRSVGLDKDGTQLVSGSADRKVKVFNLTTDPITGRGLLGPNSSIIYSSFLSNSICIGYRCGTIKYYVEDLVQPVIFDSVIGRLEGFTPIDKYNYFGWRDSVQIVDYNNFKQTVKYNYRGHTKKITACSRFNENVYLSGSSDRALHLWDIRCGKGKFAEMKPHKSGVIGLDTFDDNKFGSFGCEKILCLWDIRMLKLPTITFDNRVEVLTHEGNVIACGCGDGKIRFYLLDLMQFADDVQCNTGSSFSTIDYKNQTVACGAKNGRVYVAKSSLSF
ncbi:hypothetical protein EIN_133840 [Entamoeba invadens IP1]|uniref:Uncharacterized protein n=1 Tax=Entamoeba invadens IP1 TaxID=370355 RepID=A0A0A1TX49_ENTIV|nr:hypothetical protein EIN_133840 [Entamoeba invadens IP1]ELP85880.1 hypothetical protein EIN_133840 [Entamoeba invadens IP1]|eukprot:XP_004185226.1 hypothetical protein EIN_133840 [Entamoeba invadens IP1]